MCFCSSNIVLLRLLLLFFFAFASKGAESIDVILGSPISFIRLLHLLTSFSFSNPRAFRKPWFLFYSGFYVRAWHIMMDARFMRVCPIQLHFHREICLVTRFCDALRSNISLMITSRYLILKMRLRHVLMNVCNL